MEPISGLQQVLQRESVRHVLYRYCELVDENDVAGLVDLFTDDAMFDYGFGRVFRGADQLTELFRRIDDNAATSHHLTNVRVTLDEPGRAYAASTVYAYHVRRDGSTYELFGRYRDVLAYDGSRWRLAERSLRAAGERGTTPPEGLPTQYEQFPRHRPI